MVKAVSTMIYGGCDMRAGVGPAEGRGVWTDSVDLSLQFVPLYVGQSIRP